MNLDKYTLEQLKALCYDQLVILNQTQININILEAEIKKRITPQDKKDESQ